MLVRALSNLAVCVVPGREARFLTPEQGNYSVLHEGHDDTFLHAVAARLAPLAESTLVVDNIFTPDLEPELWGGDEQTRRCAAPASASTRSTCCRRRSRSRRSCRRATCATSCASTRLGGLSYGNLSARKDDDSASG